ALSTTRLSVWQDTSPNVRSGAHIRSVVPGMRGRGVATAACRLLLAVAWHDGASVVEAETEPGNVASQRVLAGAGFLAGPTGRWTARRPGDGRAR
ncbi:MAG: GNAT family N-acetyltransferase, partial [Actinomycetes bacterium]